MAKRAALELAPGPFPVATPQTDELPHVYTAVGPSLNTALEEQWLDRTGARYRCVNFAYVVKGGFNYTERAEEAYNVNMGRNLHVMMDSSAYSFHNWLNKQSGRVSSKKGGKVVLNKEELREQVVGQYVEFCKKDGKKWDFYANFDYIKHAPTIWKMQERLEGMGIRPTPVYHGDVSLDWLRHYIDAGYTRICIGTTAKRASNWQEQRRYLDAVFAITEPANIKTHAFGVTSLSLTFGYPWHSVDSSSWARASMYGSIYIEDPVRGSMNTMHVSNMAGHRPGIGSFSTLSPEVQKDVRRRIEAKGFDLDLLQRSGQYRFIYNGFMFVHLHDFKKYLKGKHTSWQTLV